MRGKGRDAARSGARNVAAFVDPAAQRRSEAATALDLDESRAVLAAVAGLRDSARWTLLSEGVLPRVVMELLGHSQMRTTMEIYSHVMPALAREAADRMGAVLLSPFAAKPATSQDLRSSRWLLPFGNGWS